MLSDVLKQIRKKNYLNQTAFANKIGVTQSAISQWENGLTSPNAEQLKSISQAFNISIDDLLQGEPVAEAKAEKAPRTAEARAVSFGMDNLTKEQRELILNMVTAMFPDKFTKGTDADDT